MLIGVDYRGSTHCLLTGGYQRPGDWVDARVYWWRRGLLVAIVTMSNMSLNIFQWFQTERNICNVTHTMTSWSLINNLQKLTFITKITSLSCLPNVLGNLRVGDCPLFHLHLMILDWSFLGAWAWMAAMASFRLDSHFKLLEPSYINDAVLCSQTPSLFSSHPWAPSLDSHSTKYWNDTHAFHDQEK